MKNLLSKYNCYFQHFKPSDAVAMFVGDTEEKIRLLFQKAKVSSKEHEISIIYIESIVSILTLLLYYF